jgi:hypothetical protein
MSCNLRLNNGRSWSNERLKFISKSLPEFNNALNCSGHLDLDKQGSYYQSYFKVEKYTISSFENDSTYSNPKKLFLLNLDEDCEKVSEEHYQNYDLIFNHTVLEHVMNPYQAFANFENLLAPNGILICVVPFIYKFHFSNGDFGDYWRFTPHTMELLHKQFNLSVKFLEVGPHNSYEKYIISVATRGSNVPNLEFDKKQFSEWNESLGNNSLSQLIQMVFQKTLDSVKVRIVHRINKRKINP